MTLLISKVNQLGDNVVFLPVVQQLRAVFRQLRIVVVTSPVAAPLFEHCVQNVEVISTPTRDFNAAWKHPRQLLRLGMLWKGLRPDMVMLGNDQGNVAALLSRVSGAKVRVGPALPRLHATRFLNRQVTYDLKRHVVLQNWELAQEVANALGDRLGHIPPPPDLGGLCTGKPLAFDVVVHPGASRDYKRWPLERFVAVAEALSAHHQVAWIDDGRPTQLGGTVSFIKPAHLSDFVSLMSRARLFIGNNSGPMNIACALGTKAIIFNGPSTPNWDPFWHQERFLVLRDSDLVCQPCDLVEGPVNQCRNLASPMACMKRWSVEDVISMARRLLSEA